MKLRTVGVTGLGTVCALGDRVDEAVRRAWNGESGIRRCDDHLWGDHGKALRCRVAATVEGFDPSRWVSDRAAGWTDRATGFALAAAEEAIEEAGLGGTARRGAVHPDRVGVVIGTAAPGNDLWHRVLARAFLDGAAADLPGRALPQMSAHVAASLLALRHGFRGPTFAVVDACASGATAIALAADTIRLGRADAMVVIGADAPIGLTIFGSMLRAGAMHATDDPERASRPFSPDRAGLVVGEGAGALVLEAEDLARTRGAAPRVRLLGEAQTNDAHHIYAPDPTGGTWARTMTMALEAAGVAPEQVGWVDAHAASTPLGDVAETRAVRLALGAHAERVPVSATKSMHGHTFGAAGAIETVLALAAVERGWLLPTAHLEPGDPECDLDYVPDARREGRPEVLLKNSFGFGGTNTCLVFGRAEG